MLLARVLAVPPTPVDDSLQPPMMSPRRVNRVVMLMATAEPTGQCPKTSEAGSQVLGSGWQAPDGPRRVSARRGEEWCHYRPRGSGWSMVW